MLKIAFDKIYEYQLDKNHRFPMEKYEKLPKKLIEKGIADSSNFFKPNFPNIEDILLTHKKNYVDKLNNLMLSKNLDHAL